MSCESGTYNYDQTTCDVCPAGYYCPDVFNLPLVCADNQYSFAGSTSSGDCDYCPAGYACEASNVTPTKCPEGYYSAVGTSGTANLECRPCQAGYYCPSPDTETQVEDDLHYALQGSTFKIEVPSGFQWVARDQPPIRCGAGTYWDSSTATCPKCDAGNYCPQYSGNADDDLNIVGEA